MVTKDMPMCHLRVSIYLLAQLPARTRSVGHVFHMYTQLRSVCLKLYARLLLPIAAYAANALQLGLSRSPVVYEPHSI